MIDDLYSDRILRLAANMPRAGRLKAPDGTAERTAKLCGSRIVVDVRVENGRITDYAQDVQACALGQAAAAVLGANVIGADVEEIGAAREALRTMLKSGGAAPAGRFADLAVLRPVKDFPARHASTMLAFDALMAALSVAAERTAKALA